MQLLCASSRNFYKIYHLLVGGVYIANTPYPFVYVIVYVYFYP